MGQGGKGQGRLFSFPAEKKSAGDFRKDPLWDALVEVFGYSPKVETERNIWNHICREFRDAAVTPDEIRKAAVGYRLLFRDDVLMTPVSLSKHFGQSLAKAQERRRSSIPRAAKRLVSVEEAIRRKEQG